MERWYVTKRAVELASKGVKGYFNTAHLCKVHWYLFRDVFPWAGEFRVVGLSKPGSAPFAAPSFIVPALDDLNRLKTEDHLRGLNVDCFVERAGYFLGEINAIHPFREGNGRTQREFLRQLAAQAGHTISWAGFTQEQMTAASILSHTRSDNAALATIVRAAIVTA